MWLKVVLGDETERVINLDHVILIERIASEKWWFVMATEVKILVRQMSSRQWDELQSALNDDLSEIAPTEVQYLGMG